MDQRILEFIGDLRRAEIRISPSEALDALAASSEVGLADRETFKATLAATLIKEFRDQPTFDRLFNLYFLDLQALGEGLKKALGPEDPRVQDMLDELMADENMDLDELTELLMRGQGSEMEMAIRSGGQNAGLERLMYFLQVGFFSRRISDKFDWSAIEGDLERIMNEKLTREVLSDKPLFALTPDEIAQMKSVVARLARKIKDALALRQRQEHKGRLDTRRTTRKSLQYGGVPMEIFLKRRHREKPKLITICDVSDSVRNASRFILPGRARHRVGAQGRAGRLPLPLGLRIRVQPVHENRARLARPQDDDPHAGRCAQQLQRSPGVGAAPHPRAREGHHLAESGRPVGLGHWRQRHAALRALVRLRARMSDDRSAR